MAGLDQILLQAGEILVTQSDSIVGVTDTPSGFQWGSIVQVSDLSNNAVVGNNVLFNPDKAVSSFKISVTDYWIITEDQISMTEEFLP